MLASDSDLESGTSRSRSDSHSPPPPPSPSEPTSNSISRPIPRIFLQPPTPMKSPASRSHSRSLSKELRVRASPIGVRPRPRPHGTSHFRALARARDRNRARDRRDGNLGADDQRHHHHVPTTTPEFSGVAVRRRSRRGDGYCVAQRQSEQQSGISSGISERQLEPSSEHVADSVSEDVCVVAVDTAVGGASADLDMGMDSDSGRTKRRRKKKGPRRTSAPSRRTRDRNRSRMDRNQRNQESTSTGPSPPPPPGVVALSVDVSSVPSASSVRKFSISRSCPVPVVDEPAMDFGSEFPPAGIPIGVDTPRPAARPRNCRNRLGLVSGLGAGDGSTGACASGCSSLRQISLDLTRDGGCEADEGGRGGGERRFRGVRAPAMATPPSPLPLDDSEGAQDLASFLTGFKFGQQDLSESDRTPTSMCTPPTPTRVVTSLSKGFAGGFSRAVKAKVKGMKGKLKSIKLKGRSIGNGSTSSNSNSEVGGRGGGGPRVKKKKRWRRRKKTRRRKRLKKPRALSKKKRERQTSNSSQSRSSSASSSSPVVGQRRSRSHARRVFGTSGLDSNPSESTPRSCSSSRSGSESGLFRGRGSGSGIDADEEVDSESDDEDSTFTATTTTGSSAAASVVGVGERSASCLAEVEFTPKLTQKKKKKKKDSPPNRKKRAPLRVTVTNTCAFPVEKRSTSMGGDQVSFHLRRFKSRALPPKLEIMRLRESQSSENRTNRIRSPLEVIVDEIRHLVSPRSPMSPVAEDEFPEMTPQITRVEVKKNRRGFRVTGTPPSPPGAFTAPRFDHYVFPARTPSPADGHHDRFKSHQERIGRFVDRQRHASESKLPSTPFRRRFGGDDVLSTGTTTSGGRASSTSSSSLPPPRVETTIVQQTPGSEEEISSGTDSDLDDFFGLTSATDVNRRQSTALVSMRRASVSPFWFTQHFGGRSKRRKKGKGKSKSKSGRDSKRRSMAARPCLLRKDSFYVRPLEKRRKTVAIAGPKPSKHKKKHRKRKNSLRRENKDGNTSNSPPTSTSTSGSTGSDDCSDSDSTPSTGSSLSASQLRRTSIVAMTPDMQSIRRSSTTANVWSVLRNPFLTFTSPKLERKYLTYLYVSSPFRLLAMCLFVPFPLLWFYPQPDDDLFVGHVVALLLSLVGAFAMIVPLAIVRLCFAYSPRLAIVSRFFELLSGVLILLILCASTICEAWKRHGFTFALPLCLALVFRPRVTVFFSAIVVHYAIVHLIAIVLFAAGRSNFDIAPLVFLCLTDVVAAFILFACYVFLNDTLRQIFLRRLELEEKRTELQAVRDEMKVLLGLIFPPNLVSRVRRLVLRKKPKRPTGSEARSLALVPSRAGSARRMSTGELLHGTPGPSSPRRRMSLPNLQPLPSLASTFPDGSSSGTSYCIVQNVAHAHVLEADLAGFTAWSGSVSCQVVTDTLNLLFSFYDLLVEKLGAEKVKSVGDALIALQRGNSREECASSAVLLGICIAAATSKVNRFLALDLPVRVGIATGKVSVCVLGSPTSHLRFDIFGDVVQQAIEQEKGAPHNGVRVDQELHDLTSQIFEFQDRSLQYGELSSLIHNEDALARATLVLSELSDGLLPGSSGRDTAVSPSESESTEVAGGTSLLPKAMMSQSRGAGDVAGDDITRPSSVSCLTPVTRHGLFVPLLVFVNWDDEKTCLQKLQWKPRNLVPYGLGSMLFCSSCFVLWHLFEMDFDAFLTIRPAIIAVYCVIVIQAFSLVVVSAFHFLQHKFLVGSVLCLLTFNVVLWLIFLVLVNLYEPGWILSPFLFASAQIALILDYSLHFWVRTGFIFVHGLLAFALFAYYSLWEPLPFGSLCRDFVRALGLVFLSGVVCWCKESSLKFAFEGSKHLMRAAAQIWREKRINERICRSVLPRRAFDRIWTNRLKSFSTIVKSGYCCFVTVCDKNGEGVRPVDVMQAEALCQIFSHFDRQLDACEAVPVKTVQSTYIFTIDVARFARKRRRSIAQASVPPPVNYESRTFEMILHLALFCISSIPSISESRGYEWSAKAGIAHGSFGSGVIGLSAWCWDIFGNTVNLAARLAANSEPGFVTVGDENIAPGLENLDSVRLASRGSLELKGKGEIDVSFVLCTKKKLSPIAQRWLIEKVMG